MYILGVVNYLDCCHSLFGDSMVAIFSRLLSHLVDDYYRFVPLRFAWKDNLFF